MPKLVHSNRDPGVALRMSRWSYHLITCCGAFPPQLVCRKTAGGDQQSAPSTDAQMHAGAESQRTELHWPATHLRIAPPRRKLVAALTSRTAHPARVELTNASASRRLQIARAESIVSRGNRRATATTCVNSTRAHPEAAAPPRERKQTKRVGARAIMRLPTSDRPAVSPPLATKSYSTMTMFNPVTSPSTLRLNYPPDRPRHPLTPQSVREWYAAHCSPLRFLAWREEDKIGFKLGVDELCWREEEVRSWHLQWVRPAKGWGSVELHVELGDALPAWVLRTEPFSDIGLLWSQQLGTWLEGCGFSVTRSDYGADS